LRDGTESAIAESPEGRTLVSPRSEGPPMLTEVQFDQLRAEILQRKAEARAAGTESLEAPIPEGLFPSVSDHSLDRYLSKIAAKLRP